MIQASLHRFTSSDLCRPLPPSAITTALMSSRPCPHPLFHAALQSRDPVHHAEVVSALSQLPFVVTRDGQRRRPADLYDPQQQLFGDVMLPLMALQQQQQPQGQGQDAAALAAALFPAAPFDSPNWLPVLRDCGLVHRVDLDIYMRLAKQFADVAGSIAAAAVASVAPADPPAQPASAGAQFIDLSALSASQAERLVACGRALQQYLLQQHNALIGGARSTAEQRAALAALSFAPAKFGLPGRLWYYFGLFVHRRARLLLARLARLLSAKTSDF